MQISNMVKQMTKLKRRLRTVFLALLLTATMVAGFVVFRNMNFFTRADDAEEPQPIALLNQMEDFVVEGGRLQSISDTGRGKLTDSQPYRVQIPAGVTMIGTSAFKGETWLAEIDLTGIVAISEEAFADCTMLSVLELPAGLTALGYGAFSGAAMLQFAYLPSGVNYLPGSETDATDTPYFPAQSLLIFEDFRAYSRNADKANIGVQKSQMTYIVNVDFQPGDGTSQKMQKLYGKPFTYVKQENGAWQIDGDLTLPIQPGYANTVWLDEPDEGKAITVSDINVRLSKENVTDFSLYANYLNRDLVDFRPNDYTFDPAVEFNPLTDLAELVRIIPPAGGVAEPFSRFAVKRCLYNGESVERIYDAGTYTLVINLSDPARNGEWTQDITVDLNVAKQTIDLSEFANVHWGVEGTSLELGDGILYEYSYSVGGVKRFYYSITLLDAAPDNAWQNWRYEGVLPSAVHSIVYIRKNPITVVIKGPYADDAAFNVVYGGETTASSVGKYNATATLTADKNYRFVLPGNVSTLDIADREVKIVLTGNNDGATFTKNWYIINSNDKALLDEEASIAAKKEIGFEVPSWVFGAYATVRKPRLQHSNRNGYDYTFDLAMVIEGESVPICTEANSDTWEFYFNDYMPAAKYALTIHADAISMGYHTHWWNGEAHGDPSDEGDQFEFAALFGTYEFEVRRAELQVLDPDISGSQAWEVDLANLQSNGYGAFFARLEGGRVDADHRYDPVNTVYDTDLTRSKVQASDTYWATVADLYFDEAPAFSYNLERMHSAVYMESGDPLWRDYINKPGDYWVYYRATMKNYVAVPDLTYDRYSKYYSILVYRMVEAPTLNRTEFTYTGRVLTANYTSENHLDGLLYTVLGNSAVDAGSYEAIFTLGDKIHYRWANGLELNAENDLILRYEILPAPIVIPTVESKRYTGQSILAEIAGVANLDGESVFDIDYGAGHSDGYFLDVGRYPIVLTLKDPENYIWEEKAVPEQNGTIVIYFEIEKAQNEWTANLHITPWHWRDYNREINRITTAVIDGVPTYSVRDKDHNVIDVALENFVSVDGLVSEAVKNLLMNLPAGTYYLTASVNDTQNYAAPTPISYQFEVLPAANVWVESANVIRWYWNSFNEAYNTISAKALYGDTVVFSVLRNGEPVEGLESFTSYLNVLGYLSDLPVGQYTLHAHVDGDLENGNYTELNDDIMFNVLQATNYWVQAPNIIRWTLGNFNEEINIITAEPRYGIENLRFSVTRNGVAVPGLESFVSMTDEGVIAALQALQTGEYELSAVVLSDENRNFTELNTRITFNVLTAQNRWLQVPNIIRWTWHDYNKDYNTITAVPAYGNPEDVRFSILRNGEELPGLSQFNEITDEIADLLYELPRGVYILRARLGTPEDDFYLSMDVNFYVLQATNYWVQTPNISRWIAGIEEPNLPIGESRYGTPEFRIYSTVSGENGLERGELIYDSTTGLNNLSEAPAGWYRMIAGVRGDDNFTSLDSTEFDFRIFEPETEAMNVARENALESLRLYAAMYDIVFDDELTAEISAATTIQGIVDALDNAMKIVDERVFRSVKDSALEQLEAYEEEYSVSCSDSVRAALEGAATIEAVNDCLAAAKADVDRKAAKEAKDSATRELNDYEVSQGMQCDRSFKDRIESAYSANDVRIALAEAKADIDAKVLALQKAKENAIIALRSYFGGKGLEYSDSFAVDINTAASIEEVERALEDTIESVRRKNAGNGTVTVLIVTTAVFGGISLAGAGAVVYLFVIKKKKLV